MLSKVWLTLKRVLQFRIKRWNTAMRGHGEQGIRVLICLEDNIWYWVLLEWLFWDVQTHVCSWMEEIKPFPRFVLNWKRVWDKEWDPEPSTFEEWYGDSLHSIWHCNICDPLLQWVWKHKNRYEPDFELTLDEARKKFAHDPEVYRWVEKELEEQKQRDAERAAEESE